MGWREVGDDDIAVVKVRTVGVNLADLAPEIEPDRRGTGLDVLLHRTDQVSRVQLDWGDRYRIWRLPEQTGGLAVKVLASDGEHSLVARLARVGPTTLYHR